MKVDMKTVWVVSFSPAQCAWHCEPILEHVYKNMDTLAFGNLEHADYCAVYIGTEEQCREIYKKRAL